MHYLSLLYFLPALALYVGYTIFAWTDKKEYTVFETSPMENWMGATITISVVCLIIGLVSLSH